MNHARTVSDIAGIVLDLDGTVYLGDAPLAGAVEAIAALRDSGKRILFVSNKPLEPREAYAEKLTQMGIPARPEDILPSAYVLARHLASHAPGLRLYVIGEDYLRAELRANGLAVVDDFWEQDPMQVIDPQGIDAVVVAFDRTLDYRKLNTAYQALRRGAHFYATNADNTCPMPFGAIPDAGATLAALEHITGRCVELIAGKPSTLILQTALERLDLPAARCLMVGDRLETDIRMGQAAGMFTAVVLTGASSRSDVERLSCPPDFVLDGLGQLPEVIAGAAGQPGERE